MAFCPNCGTPNTDQAEKCVSCAFELAPKQKAKFKGTIMMSGVQAPAVPLQPPIEQPPQAAPSAPAPAPEAAPAPPPARNLAFEKTMMGPMVVTPAAAPPQGQPGNGGGDLGRAATVEQPAPNFQQPPAPQPPQAAAAPASFGGAAAGSSTGNFSGAGSAGGPSFGGAGGASGPSFGGGAGGGGFGGTTQDMPAVPPKSSTGKMIAIGCASLLVLACVISGIILVVKGKQFFSLAGKVQSEGPTLEWRSRVAQSLNNVIEICKSDCQGAGVYFHPQRTAQLVAAAKDLNDGRLAKLIDPTQSEARMLDATDDARIASELSLDPQQCVRIVAGSAKVVGCSVPDASGSASLRIVHLEGLSSL